MDRLDLDTSFCDDLNEFQSKWTEIVVPKSVNILVAVFYRHPQKNSNEKFNEHLIDILEKITKENKQIFITGDFNYHLLDHSNNPHTDRFLDTMLTNFIQPCILEPTRVVNGNKPSLIDNIFTNAINKKIVSGNLLNKISDHIFI